MFDLGKSRDENSYQAKDSEEKELKSRKPCRRNSFVKILEALMEESEAVTIIIRAGDNCCELEGCVLAVNQEFATLLLANNDCGRIYIRLDYICAIISPD
ncbi:MAG: hypothetical protein ACOCRK_10015 [bacterium]